MNRDLKSILSDFKLNPSSYNKLRLLGKKCYENIGPQNMKGWAV